MKLSILLAIVGIALASCTKSKDDKPESKTPVITITAQPAATTTVTAGSINGGVLVTASVTESATLSYQWYSNTSASNIGGTPISGESGTSFAIPTTLTAAESPYYYFCEVSATGGAATVRSSAATVTVTILQNGT